MRDRLLARFGLFGIRLSTSLIRQGATAPPRSRRSWSRAAGSASWSRCCRPSSPSAATCSRPGRRCWRWTACCARDDSARGPLAREIERILAGAHEFAELRLLSALRVGAVELPNGTPARPSGCSATPARSPPARLGLAPDARPEELAEAAYAALERWRRHAVNPMLGRATTDACRTVVRSCEGILAGLG